MKATLFGFACLLGLMALMSYDIKHNRAPQPVKPVVLPAMVVHAVKEPRYASAVSVIECDTALAVAVAKSDGSMRLIHEPTEAQLKLLESVITDQEQQFRIVIPCGHEGERL